MTANTRSRVQPAHRIPTHSDTQKQTTDLFVVGQHVMLSGIVQVDGHVLVHGRLDADIHCNTLQIASNAYVDGVIAAEEMDVSGRVSGEIFCNRIVIRSNAVVEAELNYRDLILEPGSLFEGRSRRHGEPLKFAPSFDV